MRFRVFMTAPPMQELTFVCSEVVFPHDEGKEPPDSLLQAVRFCQEWGVDLGDTVDLSNLPAKPVIARFTGKDFKGRLDSFTYLVGFSAPET